jgi:isocitrate dehydrogenase
LTQININTSQVKTLVGIDIFFDWKTSNARLIAERINNLELGPLELKTISTKGLKLWPHLQDNFQILSDHWCCRFMKKNDIIVSHEEISNLLQIITKEGLDFVQTCNLYKFDDKLGFSLAQGE